jgi:uncharacterized glyoxalase superfamily protein PhnB
MIPNRSVPDATVIPVLSYPDVTEASDWLSNAFGLTVRLRIAGHRVQMLYGDGAVILTDQGAGEGASGHSVHIRVEDADSHYRHAATAGAKVGEPPTQYPFGEKQYGAQDPWGHRWTFSESTDDVDPASWGATDINID